EARDVKVERRLHERHEGADRAPRTQDAGQPNSRAISLRDERAGDLEDDIAGEEDAGPKAEYLGVEAEVLVHRQRGIADVDTIEICDDRGNEQREYDVEIDLPLYAHLERGVPRARHGNRHSKGHEHEHACDDT